MAVSSLVPASSGMTIAEGLAAGFASPAWVQVADTTVTTAASYTFTGLSSYKKLKLGVTGVESLSAGGPVYIIFNSDTGNNYSWTNRLINNLTSHKTIFGSTQSQIVLSGIGAGGYQFHTSVEIENVSGTHKQVQHQTHVSGEDYYSSNSPTAVHGFGTWRSNTVISSITFVMPSTTNASGKIHIWGQA